jgi:intracellular sulfur oxidation DsrE/DsrF family protein
MKKSNEYRVVFHLEQPDPQRLHIAVNNTANLIADKGMAVQAAFVANFKAPQLFLAGESGTEWAETAAQLVNRGILTIYLCKSSLKSLHLAPESLLPFCKIVPAGISRIIELQNEGFAYIKP